MNMSDTPRQHILQSLTTCAEVEPPLRDAADHLFVRYVLDDSQRESELSRFETELTVAQDPETGALPSLHSFGMALRALNMICVSPPVPFAFFLDWQDPDALIRLICELDWSEPWRSSIKVLHAVTPIALQKPSQMVDVLDALESHQAENGGWGCHREPHHQMAAAFHFLPIYSALGRTMPRLDRLANLAAEMRFDHLTGFLPMDTAYIVRCALVSDALKRDKTDAFFAHLEKLLTTPDADFGDRHSHVAAAQLLFVLAEWHGETDYRDAWDSKLWRIHVGE